jgi:hypothetical protein
VAPEFQWIRSGVTGGFYPIKNVATGMYIYTDGFFVAQQPYTGAKNQLWKDLPVTTIRFFGLSWDVRLLINASNGLCMTRRWVFPFVDSVVTQNCDGPPYQNQQLWWAYPYW